VLLRTAVDLAYACPRADDAALELLTAMYSALPRREEAAAEAEAEAAAAERGGATAPSVAADVSSLLDEVPRHELTPSLVYI